MNGIEGEESEELDPNSGAGKLIEMVRIQIYSPSFTLRVFAYH
jgi:hypothetical protein